MPEHGLKARLPPRSNRGPRADRGRGVEHALPGEIPTAVGGRESRGETAYFAGAVGAGMAGIACNSFKMMAGSMAGAMFCMFIICPQVP
jgi:hypothetical protein